MFGRLLRFLIKWKKPLIFLFLFLLIWYAFCIPSNPFRGGYSTVLYDRNGELLEARVAADGQWRFPPSHNLSSKLNDCIIEFEDRRFHKHIGVSARGIGRAISQNWRSGRIVSGGSTITMQLARMMCGHKKRSVFNKIHEMLLATRLEIKYSKKEILDLYLANAPFGNNVVGADAAAWRYFGKPADKLSWGESATLAVLPNAPGLMYPGKNQQQLTSKRNRLLKRLLQQNKIDSLAFELAVMERVPGKPLQLANKAPHLLQRLVKENGRGRIFNSTIDEGIQLQVSRIAKKHHEFLSNNNIHNGAVIVASTKTGEVISYIGNIADSRENESSDVDCARAPRSSGSILKPLLFESALEDGMITPKSLLFDIPSHFSGYSPKNFNKTYEGAVPAVSALSKSLNIPFVLLLNQYGTARFCERLQSAGIQSIQHHSGHYGLTLILGGAEVTLFDMATAYRNMGAIGMRQQATPLHYLRKDFSQKRLLQWNRECALSTLNAMTELNRPDEEGNWKLFASAKKIAWKTGTSFGFRDGWAIGITPEYTVAVWIGNANGEGQPGLTGVNTAAPLMFDIFSNLKTHIDWFPQSQNLQNLLICKESGNPASPDCPHKVTERLPFSCSSVPCCNFHKVIKLSPDKKYQANSNCYLVSQLSHDTFFNLPPLALKYFRERNNIKEIPDFEKGCGTEQNNIHIVYPKANSRILLHSTTERSNGEVVFEIVNKNPGYAVYWHLDDEYIGSTKNIHQVISSPEPGKHVLSVSDESGHRSTVSFEVAAH